MIFTDQDANLPDKEDIDVAFTKLTFSSFLQNSIKWSNDNNKTRIQKKNSMNMAFYLLQEVLPAIVESL